MVRFLLRTLIFLGSAALGLFVAHLLLDDFALSISGFIVAVVVFALAQSIVAPIAESFARNRVPALVGGIGVISTFLALLIATLLADGLAISGAATWILGTLIVWLVTALATSLLPLLLIKDDDEHGSGKKGAGPKSEPRKRNPRNA